MIYLSGKITNSDPEIKKENLAIFHVKAKELRDQGHEVFNPAELEQEGKPYEDYLVYELKWIIENKPVLYVMKEWENSRGTRLELAMAKLLGLRVIYEDTNKLST